jgi:hypothetical protein
VALRSDGEVIYAGRKHGGTIPELPGARRQQKKPPGEDAGFKIQYFSDNGLRETEGKTLWRGMMGAAIRRNSDGEAHIDVDESVGSQWVLNNNADRLQLQGMGLDVEPHVSESMDNADLYYVQVSAGYCHTALLRSDGVALAFGNNDSGQCDLPLEPSFKQLSAGGAHTILLHKDGSVSAKGLNNDHQCDVPACNDEAAYVQISAGRRHTVLLRSDGLAKAVGCNESGQCDIPYLNAGLRYLQVSAGGNHTALLRSDGQVVTCGVAGGILIPAVLECQPTADWLMTRPALPPSVKYVADFGERPIHFIEGNGNLVVQVFAKLDAAKVQIECSSVAGNRLAAFEVGSDVSVYEVQNIICEKLSIERWRLQAVLPCGHLMNCVNQHALFAKLL